MFKNKKLLLHFFLAFFLSSASPNNNANINGNSNSNNQSSINSIAYIYGIPYISVEEVKKLNFGTISRPISDVHATVKFNNSLSGTAHYLDTSTGSAGEYKIHGSYFNTISIQAQDLGTYQFMKFMRMQGRYPGNFSGFNLFQGAANLLPPGNGKILKIAAQLKVKGNTPQGDYSPAFSISINYD